MKQTLFTILLLTTMGLMSCRKSGNDIDIKQFDQQQIEGYIAANGITGMQRDTTGGDTSGIYYKIITPGTGDQVDYPDDIAYVYTKRSFDGKFVAEDTVINHFDGLLGYTAPLGLRTGIHNLLKYKGGKIRLLIPSHLGYGTDGTGQGSSSNTTGRIAGNQCLDYTVNLIDQEDVYDDMVIKNYMAAKSLSGYTEVTAGKYAGIYYKITTPGTGTAPITLNSTITCTYTGLLFNGTTFSAVTATDGTSFNLIDLTDGVQGGLLYATAGASISIIVPSRLAYGRNGSSGIPVNACLRFDFNVLTVTN